MEKPNLHEFLYKIKSGTEDAVLGVKGVTDEVVKATKGKFSEKSSAFSKEEKSKKNAKQLKGKSAPKEKLDDSLRIAVDQYNDAYTMMNDVGATLYRERTRAVDMIDHVESLINSIANRPKEFDTDIAEIKMKRKSFVDVCEFAKAELEAAKKSALGAGAGVAAGAAIVSVAPTAAMWVATTFGTASTGTAISALSGAAATNAALAWLGGGALAAGGGGMAAGQAFLALAGPVGWGVAGVTLLSSIVLFSMKKLKLNKHKKEEIEAVKKNTNSTRKVTAQIQVLLEEVVSLREALSLQYNECMPDFGKDFTSIPKDQQMRLGALVNNTKALAVSLSKSIQ